MIKQRRLINQPMPPPDRLRNFWIECFADALPRLLGELLSKTLGADIGRSGDPDCGTPKHMFEMVEMPYAPGQPTTHIPA